MVLRCPSYSQALKWARLECKSYKISQPDIEPRISEPEIEQLISEPEMEPLGGRDHDEELPLFLRSPRNTDTGTTIRNVFGGTPGLSVIIPFPQSIGGLPTQ
jgi:hypothetical protein